MLGVAWVIAAGIAVLVPALIHGLHLGPYDLNFSFGPPTQPFHNPTLSDQITLFIPWTSQDWSQVHSGHVPLWNPYSGLGMPLAFNWESAPFGAPALVGYLFPLQYAYSAGIVATTVIAGTGAYVFARMIRLGVIAAASVGTIFVLSGPMSSLLGWSAVSVASWAGWLFAAALLVVRGHRRAQGIAGLALVLALTIFAGYPEVLIFLLIALGTFLIVLLVRTHVTRNESLVRPLIDLSVAGVAGLGLAAPLLLPGVQLARESGRATVNPATVAVATAGEYFPHLFLQGFDGLPIRGSHFFGPVLYQASAVYVGITALVLVAVAVATRRSRPEVLSLIGVSGLMALLVLAPGVRTLLERIPLIGSVSVGFALLPLAFGVACLAGIGLDALIRDVPGARRWASGGFVVAALTLVALWAFGRGHLPPAEARIREDTFLWPAVLTVVGLAVMAGLTVSVRAGKPVNTARLLQAAGGILLVCETAFLVSAGAPLWSSSPQSIKPTPPIAVLQKTVGSSLVGLGTEACVASNFFGAPLLGISPETNAMYRVHELAIYDPIAPARLFTFWKGLTGSSGGAPVLDQFCPAITTVSLARLMGVAFVLEPHDHPGPAGSIFVRSVGDEGLFRIPNSSPATVVPASPANLPAPPDDELGTPVQVHQPDPETWKLVTGGATPQLLRLRILNVPGWSATVDGHPAAVSPFAGVMLQVHIPPGRHTVVVRYWPRLFTLGLVIALGTVIGLGLALVLPRLSRRGI